MSGFLPAKLNLPIWRGATFHYRFQFLNDNGTTEVPQDVTGFTGTCPLENLNKSETYMTLSSENGGIVFNGISGLIDIIIPATTTSAITWKSAIYTLFVVNPASQETLPLLTGRFMVRGPL